MTKYTLLLLCILFSFLNSFSQIKQQATNEKGLSPKTPFTKMYLPIWEEAMEHCLAVADAMPDSLYGYKPTEISKTFAEQMVHILSLIHI